MGKHSRRERCQYRSTSAAEPRLLQYAPRLPPTERLNYILSMNPHHHACDPVCPLDLRPSSGHHEGMANYQPKGAEYMRELARLGGKNSGETRRKNRLERIVTGCKPPKTKDERHLALVHWFMEIMGGRLTFPLRERWVASCSQVLF